MMSRFGSAVAVAAIAAAAATSVASSARFDVVWNGPSRGCTACPGSEALRTEAIEGFGIDVNPGQNFSGPVISLMYKTGLFPTLRCETNATPCWTGQHPCSWDPWSDITPVVNGGVPQAANLTAHVAQLGADVLEAIPDTDFSGFAILDWEAWRPLTTENDDGLSCYTEYSKRLVREEGGPNAGNATWVAQEAASRFDAGAQAIFTATVREVKRLRPKARVGFYSQGINQASGGAAEDNRLLWLWEEVDVLCPSIYPRSTNTTKEAASVNSTVSEAVRAASLVSRLRGLRGDDRPPPAVMPYARALVSAGGIKLTRGQLACAVQIAAGVATDGVILWGSSGDYRSCSDCGVVASELASPAGPLIKQCAANRNACAQQKCSGHGRCADYTDESQLEATCAGAGFGSPLRCRCDPGYSGASCENGPRAGGAGGAGGAAAGVATA